MECLEVGKGLIEPCCIIYLPLTERTFFLIMFTNFNFYFVCAKFKRFIYARNGKRISGLGTSVE